MKGEHMQRAKSAQADEIRALKRMKDREIDTTNIPPVLDWSKAVVGKFYRPTKKPAKPSTSNRSGGHPEGLARFPTMSRYEIIMCWSEEDEKLVADLSELPGCAAHGPTHDRALRSAQDAIRLWIDTANEFGDPVPEPKGRGLLLA
ncbi:MAG: type II toxin-antitoxin system HicB family antitoxin [Bryobacteraceae bacterium]|jgi:predicted RNase H-like HicB family nuclease